MTQRRAIVVLALFLLSLSACGSPVERADWTSSTPPTSASSSSPSQPRQAMVVMNGDLLWHNSLVFGAREDAGTAGRSEDLDFGPLLAGVRPVVETADLAICHNEVPVAPPGGPYRYYPAFRAPAETLDAVAAAGYDLCTTASNHSLDDGWDGLVRTLDALDARGLQHSGTARTETEAEQPTIHSTTGGVRIAIITGTYDTNGIPRPHDREWSVPDLDVDTLLRRASAARAAGADVVLVAIHGGDEYSHQPNTQQRELAEALTASPAVDLVYGHHVHVVQPWTKVNGKWVVYGLGNLVAQHLTTVPAGYEGVTARFTFAEQPDGRFSVTRAEYFPTLVTRYQPGQPARVLLVNEALASGSGDSDRLQVARERTNRVVHSLGGAEEAIEG